MTINYSLYLPLEKALENANRQQKQIYQAFKKHNKEMGFNDIARAVQGLMGRVQCKREMNNLERQEIIFKTDSGKYRLRKEVCIEKSRHSFKTDISDGKIQDSHKEWYNLDELPPKIRDMLQNP